ncbi:MAG: DUF1269 domain-containing protein [Betaproteobacteria bacterium]
MSKLVAIAYDSVAEAEQTRAKVLAMQKEYLITLDDIAIAYTNDKGKIKLHQAVNMTATGAASGSFWGLLIGLIFMMPIFGVVAGTAAGAISGALADIGIDDKMMKELAASLRPDGAILFVLARSATEDKVLAGLQGAGGKVIQTSLTHGDETKLQAALAAAHTLAA